MWMVVLVEHESNVMSDVDDRPTGGLNENQYPEGAHTGHISRHSQKQEFSCIGELRQLCSQRPTGEGEQADPPGTKDPPMKGGTGSKRQPPQTGTLAASLAL